MSRLSIRPFNGVDLGLQTLPTPVDMAHDAVESGNRVEPVWVGPIVQVEFLLKWKGLLGILAFGRGASERQWPGSPLHVLRLFHEAAEHFVPHSGLVDVLQVFKILQARLPLGQPGFARGLAPGASVFCWQRAAGLVAIKVGPEDAVLVVLGQRQEGLLQNFVAPQMSRHLVHQNLGHFFVRQLSH